MAAYRRVYDARHLQADCQEPGSATEPYARQSSTGYLLLQNAPFRSKIFKIFFVSGGKGALTPLNQNTADVAEYIHAQVSPMNRATSFLRYLANRFAVFSQKYSTVETQKRHEPLSRAMFCGTVADLLNL